MKKRVSASSRMMKEGTFSSIIAPFRGQVSEHCIKVSEFALRFRRDKKDPQHLTYSPCRESLWKKICPERFVFPGISSSGVASFPS
jgi:hypothetical protein